MEVPPQFPKAPYLHTQVLKPAQSSSLRSALETIASDGPITAALTSTAEASVSQIPELFRSVMPSQSAAVAERAGAAVETVKKGEQEIKQLASLPGQWTSQFRGEVVRRSPAAAGHVVAQLQEWWHRERVFRVVEGALPNRKMDGLAVDGESYLPDVWCERGLTRVRHSSVRAHLRVARGGPVRGRAAGRAEDPGGATLILDRDRGVPGRACRGASATVSRGAEADVRTGSGREAGSGVRAVARGGRAQRSGRS